MEKLKIILQIGKDFIKFMKVMLENYKIQWEAIENHGCPNEEWRKISMQRWLNQYLK